MTPRSKVKVGLGAAALGVVCMLGGLVLDAYLHAHDPGLAAREGVFALGNPGHVLVGAGIVLTVIGVGTSALAVFTPRRRFVGPALLAVTVLGAGTIGIAAPSMTGRGSDDHVVTEPGGGGHASVDPDALGPEAWELLDDVRASIARYGDEEAGVAAGFRPPRDPNGPARHYTNPRNIRDDAILDPDRPEGLVYFTQNDGSQVLIGAVFKAPEGIDPPNPGGVLWHTHMPGCVKHDETCGRHTLHVWTGEGIENPFADNFRQAMGANRARELRRRA